VLIESRYTPPRARLSRNRAYRKEMSRCTVENRQIRIVSAMSRDIPGLPPMKSDCLPKVCQRPTSRNRTSSHLDVGAAAALGACAISASAGTPRTPAQAADSARSCASQRTSEQRNASRARTTHAGSAACHATTCAIAGDRLSAGPSASRRAKMRLPRSGPGCSSASRAKDAARIQHTRTTTTTASRSTYDGCVVPATPRTTRQSAVRTPRRASPRRRTSQSGAANSGQRLRQRASFPV